MRRLSSKWRQVEALVLSLMTLCSHVAGCGHALGRVYAKLANAGVKSGSFHTEPRGGAVGNCDDPIRSLQNT